MLIKVAFTSSVYLYRVTRRMIMSMSMRVIIWDSNTQCSRFHSCIPWWIHISIITYWQYSICETNVKNLIIWNGVNVPHYICSRLIFNSTILQIDKRKGISMIWFYILVDESYCKTCRFKDLMWSLLISLLAGDIRLNVLLIGNIFYLSNSINFFPPTQKIKAYFMQ